MTGTPRHPLLYLHDADDGCVRPEISALTTDILPADRVVAVAGAGHLLQVERPERVAAAITTFLDSAP